MRERVVALSIITHGAVTVQTVWSLPLWAWRGYVAEHDEWIRARKEEARRG